MQNGRGFDMPDASRAAALTCAAVAMPWWFQDRNTRYRYSTDGHFDLMDFLADFGATKNARLDVYAKLIGFPGKVGVDGSQVQPMVHAGKLDEVNTYCLCDVVQTAAIFLRVELLRWRATTGHATAMLARQTARLHLTSSPGSEAVTRRRSTKRQLLVEPSVTSAEIGRVGAE